MSKRITTDHPMCGPESNPESVVKMVEAAETNEEKVAVAFAYLRTLEGIRFGSESGADYSSKLAIIHAYEKYSGLKLLPSGIF